MLPNARYVCLLTIPLLLPISGCVNERNSDTLIAHLAVSRAVKALAPQPEELLSTTQLEALIGKPEKTLDEPAFHSLLRNVDPNLLHLFPTAATKSPLGTDGPGKRVVWVYAWERPMEFHADIVGSLGRRAIVEQWSYAYIVSESRVLFSRHIRRDLP